VGADSERFRLTNNGLEFPALAFDALVDSIIGLSKTLMRPKKIVFVHQDHVELWAWCGELMLSVAGKQFMRNDPSKESKEDDQFEMLFATVVHAALARYDVFLEDRASAEARDWGRTLLPHHGRMYLHDANIALSYLVFPFLDAVLKRACNKYVAMDGSVQNDFTVPRPQPGRPDDNYLAASNRKCSSIFALLHCHHKYVADPELQRHIEELIKPIEAVDTSKSAFLNIFNWRNETLHGQETAQFVG
jgi:hypothetical protein